MKTFVKNVKIMVKFFTISWRFGSHTVTLIFYHYPYNKKKKTKNDWTYFRLGPAPSASSTSITFKNKWIEYQEAQKHPEFKKMHVALYSLKGKAVLVCLRSICNWWSRAPAAPISQLANDCSWQGPHIPIVSAGTSSCTRITISELKLYSARGQYL